MSDGTLPIIEVQIRHMRDIICHAFCMHLDELKPYVEKALESALSSENIQNEISKQVDEVMNDCIKNVLGGYSIRQELEKIMTANLLSKLKNSSP